MSEVMRLQKWIAELGLASRREAERWIASGRVAINGKVVSQMGCRVNPLTDRLSIDGKLYRKKAPPKVYWLLNKPDKFLTARPTEREQKRTIYDLPALKKVHFIISPVGRLDYRTEGLLLMTNDGELANRLCRPEYKVPRRYLAAIHGKLSPDQLQTIKKGIELEDGLVRDVQIQYAEGKADPQVKASWYFITVHEGRNRLVRRLFEHFGFDTLRLIRIGFGEISLPQELKPGEYRQLSKKDVKYLKQSVGMESKSKIENCKSSNTRKVPNAKVKTKAIRLPRRKSETRNP